MVNLATDLIQSHWTPARKHTGETEKGHSRSISLPQLFSESYYRHSVASVVGASEVVLGDIGGSFAEFLDLSP